MILDGHSSWHHTALTGKAQQAYAALSAEDATKYAEVKAAILRRYDINEETYRQRFRATRKKEGESYTEMVIRLQDLFKKWTVGCKTVEEVSEKVVIEQLVNAMPSDLRIWIRERKLGTGAEAGNLADNYLQARKKETSLGQRSSQEVSNRSKGGVVETRKCHICGEAGHIAPFCPKKGVSKDGACKGEKSGQSDRPGPVKCYNCGKNGHIAMQCPSKALFCGERLGGANTCRGKVEGSEVTDTLLDTGCSRTMVRSSLVPEERSLEGQAVTIQCAHGDVALYPLAQVELEVGGAKFQVQAAVSDKLPVSVLLGTDVPELGKLLLANPSVVQTSGMEEALVMTRAQVKEKERAETELLEKEAKSEAKPNPVELVGGGDSVEESGAGEVTVATVEEFREEAANKRKVRMRRLLWLRTSCWVHRSRRTFSGRRT